MDGLPTKKEVYTFAYDPNDPKMMYVSLNDGVFLSKDEGRQWSLLKKSPKGVRAILFHPKDSKKVLAGTGNGRIFFSKDRGYSWILQKN